MGNLLRSCAEVREPIELLFGLVSGFGPGIGVLDGGPVSTCCKGKGRFLVCFAPVDSLVSMVYFVTEMYSTHA